MVWYQHSECSQLNGNTNKCAAVTGKWTGHIILQGGCITTGPVHVNAWVTGSLPLTGEMAHAILYDSHMYSILIGSEWTNECMILKFIRLECYNYKWFVHCDLYNYVSWIQRNYVHWTHLVYKMFFSLVSVFHWQATIMGPVSVLLQHYVSLKVLIEGASS